MTRDHLRFHINAVRERAIQVTQQLGKMLKQARTQEVDFSAVRLRLAHSLVQIRQLGKTNLRSNLAALRPWIRRHGKALTLYALGPIFAVLVLILVLNQTRAQQQMLDLRPAQLTAVESMIEDSKTKRLLADTIPTLSENEVETIKVILQNRGITMNILRLSLEQRPVLEFQTDQASFGQWVAFLEEVQRRWYLFPSQMVVKSTDSPEIVSIRGILQQDTGGYP